jgi:8-oxo-dGTP pyrophosphatase MutT (NUDIX family)
MPYRPDLVDCWMFRIVSPGVVQTLLIRRAPGRILPGLWQCVSGGLFEGERVALAALREVREETGFGPDAIEAFYDLDLVNEFHEPSFDAVVSTAVFAVRLRPDAEPVLSSEHDGARWVTLDEARREVIWPGYRTAIDRIREDVLDPLRGPWFELDLEGRRRAG